MNFNPQMVQSTWTETVVSLALIVPIFTLIMMWFGVTVNPLASLAMNAHGISNDAPLTPKNVLVCTIIIPAEVLLAQAITLIALLIALEDVVFGKSRT